MHCGELAKSGFPLLIFISVFLHTNFLTSSILMKWIGLLMSEYYNRHKRLALVCPLSNLSPVFGPSIKRKIGVREAITWQREKQPPISYLALKVELKSLYFNLVYVFLLSGRTQIYKQNTRTYIQSGAENSLFQFCLTITEPFSPFYLEEMKNFTR